MIKNWIKAQPAHVVLIAINVAVFAVQALTNVFIGLFGYQFDFFHRFLSLPSSAAELLFQPWGLFTYMFIHGDFMHLFWNMLFLFFMGSIFENTFGRRTIQLMYLTGGFVSGVIFFLAFQIFPVFSNSGNSYLMGASGAIYAIVAGISIARPKLEVALFGVLRVPLILIFLFYILGDLSSFYVSNTGGHLTHIAGAAFGAWFAFKQNKGVNILRPVNDLWSRLLGNRSSNVVDKRSAKNMKVVYRKKVKTMSDDEYNYSQKSNEQRLNQILDKIGKSGYDSLSKSEKDFLKFMSEQ